jgi:eukaryotic-like serine/threonine-protein kinase
MRLGTRFCGRCGRERRPGGRFCGNCGHVLPVSADPARVQPGLPGSGARPLPLGLASSGSAPPQRGAPARTGRRPAYLLPFAAVLAILVAGGISAATVLVIRHFNGQPAVQDNLAATSPTSAPPASTSQPQSQSQSPPPPPTQVTVDGITISIGAVNTDPDATAVAATLASYFGGIDARNYRKAWDTYSSELQSGIPFQPFAHELSTSQDSQVVVQSIQDDASGNIDADVSFQSHQAGQYGPNQGETCTNWSLDYHLVPAANPTGAPSYLINKVTDIGPGHVSC